MTVVGAIFARGGSKGIPNKNLEVVGDKPLITHAVHTALSVVGLERVIVSTDSLDIARTGLAAGAEVPFMRPTHLAEDTSAEWLSWQHMLQFLRDSEGAFPEVLASIPATSPLRRAKDVEACISEYHKGSWDAVITVTPAQRNPYFNMLRRSPDGEATIAVKSQTRYTRRQDAPDLYDMCTVAYVARAEFVLQAGSLWEGRIGSVVIPQERALDIDSPFDLKVARLLFAEENISPGDAP